VKHLKTSDIAKAVGVHSNTVRLYEEWGLLPPIPRNERGYRQYTEKHLEQLRLVRIALRCNYVEAGFRKRAISIIKLAAGADLTGALTAAYRHLDHVRREQLKAEEALLLIQRWMEGTLEEDAKVYLKRKKVADLLEVSTDLLRNWERNNLIRIVRNPDNGYRIYDSAAVNRLKVIRTLRSANYSMMSILRIMQHIDAGKRGDIRDILNTPPPEEDIIHATDQWVLTLQETEQNADQIIQQLQMMIAKFN
jgi:DNA-binding transcriptional MerR regulator